MDKVVLLLPFPPSVNRLYRNVSGIGRVKTTHAKKWIHEAGWMVKAALGPIPSYVFPDGELAFDIALERKQSKAPDIDNIVKCVSDLMTKMHVWKDDSQVADLHVGYGPVNGCKITIQKFPLHVSYSSR